MEDDLEMEAELAAEEGQTADEDEGIAEEDEAELEQVEPRHQQQKIGEELELKPTSVSIAS